jgi:hypothetical protein
MTWYQWCAAAVTLPVLVYYALRDQPRLDAILVIVAIAAIAVFGYETGLTGG